MRKRLLTVIMILSLCITGICIPIPGTGVSAAVKGNNYVPIFSEWATEDLMTGDRYDIYPLSWYEDTLTGPVTKEQMEVLTDGLTEKIGRAKGVRTATGPAIGVKDGMTVQEVLNTFYTVISEQVYDQDIDLNDTFGVESFMKEKGIFTGKNGERGITEKCSTEQACVFAVRLVTYVYDQLDAASKGFLWEVKKGDNTAYLLGSIHAADYDIYPFSEKMMDAFRNSDALVVEVDLNDEEGMAAFTSLLVYSDGTTLKDHVSEECYNRTIKTAAFYGLSEPVAASLKAWYLSNFFTVMATASGDSSEALTAVSLGIDNSFMTDAVINGKPVLEIEGYEKQGKMFDGFSEELQEYLLTGSMDELDKSLEGAAVTENTSDNLIERWLKAWHDGNIEAFESAYSAEDEVLGDTFSSSTDGKIQDLMYEYYTALLTDRDKGMAEYIDGLLNQKGKNTYFVVVGSLHYLSDYSVLDILKEKGYDIVQIK